MAFGTVQAPTPTNPLLAFFTAQAGQNAVDAGTLANEGARLGNQGVQQDQANAAQLRGLAPQLAAGDPRALATAATLGAPGAHAVGGIVAANEAALKRGQANVGTLGHLGMAIVNMDPSHQAAAYSMIAPGLRAQGFQIPDQYPGAEAIRGFAGLALDPNKVFESLNNRASSDPRGAWFGGVMGGGAGGGGAPAPAAAGGTGGPINVPAHLMPIYQQAAQDSGVPLQYLLAQGHQESRFDPNAKGTSGENGIAQVMPATGADPGYGVSPLSPEDARDPAKAIPWQARYLAARAAAAGVTDWNDPAQAARGLAAYNGAGPRAAAYGQTVLGLVPRVQVPGAPAAVPERQQVASNVGATGMPRTATDTSGTAELSTTPLLAFGDSLADGAAKANGYAGGGIVGAAPDKVLSAINNTAPEDIRGRAVLLSSGVSNDPSQIGLVEQQVGLLRSRGASEVRLVGVGPRFAGLNDRLADIAGRTGATFLGPVQAGRDGVHPADYRGLGTAPGRQADARPSVPGANGLLDLAPDGRLLAPQDMNQLFPMAVPGTATRSPAAAGAAPVLPAPTGIPNGVTGPGSGGGPRAPAPAAAPSVAPAAAGAAAPAVAGQNGLFNVAVSPGSLLGAAPAGEPPQAPPGSKPMYDKTGAPIHIEGLPGYVRGQAPDGSPTVLKLPGAPNTSRLTPAHNSDGSTTFYGASGEPVRTTPPNNREVQVQMYKEDRGLAQQQSEAAILAQQQQGKFLEARQIMQGLPTGANGEARAAWANFAETYFGPAFAQAFKSKLGLPDAVPAQEFNKLMTQSAGQQERQVAGARGGIQMMRLFKDANPGLEMQPTANRDILNMQLVAAQADQDYARGHIAWVNNQGNEFMAGKSYQPVSNFDQQWVAQRNPQIYLAATNAMNGKDFDHWGKGLKPDEIGRVRGIIASIDPGTTVMGPGGRSFRVTAGAQ